jgi:cytokinesis protein
MEEFFEELNRPSEAYRGTLKNRPRNPKLTAVLDNLQDVRKDLANLREGLKKIRQELTDHFANVEPSNQHGTKMWAFLKKASARLEDLVDDVNAAESTYSEVTRFYGEDEKNVTSSEFYGIFKTFITSYRVSVWAPSSIHPLMSSQKCKMDNQTLAEQKASAEKRRVAAEELKAARQKAQEEASENEDTSVLDNLLEKLRSGENVGRRARRARPSAATSTLTVDTTPSFDKEDPAGLARDMLARLQSDGFTAAAQTPKSNPFSSRRNRRRLAGLGVTPESPNESDSVIYNDSITLVDQSDAGLSRTNSVDGDDDDSAGDATIRVDSSS